MDVDQHNNCLPYHMLYPVSEPESFDVKCNLSWSVCFRRNACGELAGETSAFLGKHEVARSKNSLGNASLHAVMRVRQKTVFVGRKNSRSVTVWQIPHLKALGNYKIKLAVRRDLADMHLYLPPSQSDMDFFYDYVFNCHDKLCLESPSSGFIVAGDFN